MFFKTGFKTISSGLAISFGALSWILYPSGSVEREKDHFADFQSATPLYDPLKSLSERYSTRKVQLTLKNNASGSDSTYEFTLNALQEETKRQVKDKGEGNVFDIPEQDSNGKSYKIMVYSVNGEGSGKKCIVTFEEVDQTSYSGDSKAVYSEAMRGLVAHHSSSCSSGTTEGFTTTQSSK